MASCFVVTYEKTIFVHRPFTRGLYNGDYLCKDALRSTRIRVFIQYLVREVSVFGPQYALVNPSVCIMCSYAPQQMATVDGIGGL